MSADVIILLLPFETIADERLDIMTDDNSIEGKRVLRLQEQWARSYYRVIWNGANVRTCA